ncbi:hypothetical protein L5515_009095 [Caenorhabditis briggsae]|uniref:Uncharacterized protein n=1 Tax=Caenorhabditis briggsae TaxID=6238 RepID=A0AAE9JLV2_CAEBR|nr:hypothetical protein L5515_009095 [Caenorhabditis briggsae]
MSRILDRITTFYENLFRVTFNNNYVMLSVGYSILYISQFVIFLADACFLYMSPDPKNTKFENCLFMLSFFVFSVFYGLIFALVQPENRRVFGACGILASIQLVLTTIFYLYILLSTDLNDTQQILYYTNRLAPISIIYMTFLSVISVWVMCKMSFFRPNTKVITDLYEIEEKNEKKAV